QEAVGMSNQDQRAAPLLEGSPRRSPHDDRPGAAGQPRQRSLLGKGRRQPSPELGHGISSQPSEPARLKRSIAAWTPSLSARDRAAATPSRTLSTASDSRLPKRPRT